MDSPKSPDSGWEEGTNRQVALSDAAQTVARRYNEPPPPIRPVLTGTIRTHPGFSSKHLGPRDVIVYLPPDVFGNLLVLSSSAFWDDYAILKTVDALPAKAGQRIWVDVGLLEEERFVIAARRLRDALLAKG